jgi:hypothetical protein
VLDGVDAVAAVELGVSIDAVSRPLSSSRREVITTAATTITTVSTPPTTYRRADPFTP